MVETLRAEAAATMQNRRELKSSDLSTTLNPASPYRAELPDHPSPAVQGLGHLEEPYQVGNRTGAGMAYRLRVSLLQADHYQKESEAGKA